MGCEEAPEPAAGERASAHRGEAVGAEAGDEGAGGDGAEGEGADGERGEGEAEGLRLRVPPRLIHRARREALGLSRMPETLRAQTLADRAVEHGLDYATLRGAPDAHEEAPVTFEGHVGLVRSAGPQLWIMALQTRRDGERWVDPLYVLGVIPPGLPADGGATARVHGWVVGERTIGRHPLPLIVAYAITPDRMPPSAGD